MPCRTVSLYSRLFDEYMKIFCFLWKKQKKCPYNHPFASVACHRLDANKDFF